MIQLNKVLMEMKRMIENLRKNCGAAWLMAAGGGGTTE